MQLLEPGFPPSTGRWFPRRCIGCFTSSFSLGIPADATGMHSLRCGGASVIYNATGGKVTLVKRLGRWASDAFEGYIWEDCQLTRGLASSTLSAPWSVHSATWAPEVAQH